MEKRTVLLGDYNTADYGWTLGPWKLSDPEQKTTYVEKLGGDGSWDLSTVLTGGAPRYQNRQLVIPLENSQGTRAEREDLINEMVNLLDGFEWHIVLPDRPDYYLVGRLHVAVDYNDLAHAKVTVTGTCEPWFYYKDERVVVLDAPITISTETATFNLWNGGRKVVVPRLDVKGVARLTFKTSATSLEEGTWTWAPLQLQPGWNSLVYTGSYAGVNESLTLTWREAVLR